VIIVPHNSAIGLSLSTAFKPVAMPWLMRPIVSW